MHVIDNPDSIIYMATKAQFSPIETFVSPFWYKHNKNLLRKYNIMFAEQITNPQKTNILSWSQACITNSRYDGQGPQPSWYKDLGKYTQQHIQEMVTIPNNNLTTPPILRFFPTKSTGKNNRKFIVTILHDQIYIGKRDGRFKQNPNHYRVSHYTMQSNTQFLIQCKGCK